MTNHCPDNTYKPQSAKDIPQVYSENEGFCEVREDNLHCECWWNNGEVAVDPCCACGYIGEEND